MIVVAGRVAVPEKTLEHWASQYISYRFHGKAALWWPTRGEDVDLDQFPARPGKAIQLEVKTTVPIGRYQDVNVDLGQLWEYRRRPLGRQPFYVFPQPDWQGSLVDFSRRNGEVATELGFARSGRGRWFADWLLVLTTAEICKVLADPLRKHGSSRRGKSVRLVRFEPATYSASWGTDHLAPPPKLLRWLPFWDRLVKCGEVDWPQLVRVPGSATGLTRCVRHDQLAGLLAHSASPAAEDLGLVTLAPGQTGFYEIDSSTRSARLTQSEQIGHEDHRVAVFLDSAALG